MAKEDIHMQMLVMRVAIIEIKEMVTEGTFALQEMSMKGTSVSTDHFVFSCCNLFVMFLASFAMITLHICTCDFLFILVNKK